MFVAAFGITPRHNSKADYGNDGMTKHQIMFLLLAGQFPPVEQCAKTVLHPTMSLSSLANVPISTFSLCQLKCGFQVCFQYCQDAFIDVVDKCHNHLASNMEGCSQWDVCRGTKSLRSYF